MFSIKNVLVKTNKWAVPVLMQLLDNPPYRKIVRHFGAVAEVEFIAEVSHSLGNQ